MHPVVMRGCRHHCGTGRAGTKRSPLCRSGVRDFVLLFLNRTPQSCVSSWPHKTWIYSPSSHQLPDSRELVAEEPRGRAEGSGLGCGRRGWPSARSLCTVPWRTVLALLPERTTGCDHTGALAPGQAGGCEARPLLGVPGPLRPPAGGLPSEDLLLAGPRGPGQLQDP